MLQVLEEPKHGRSIRPVPNKAGLVSICVQLGTQHGLATKYPLIAASSGHDASASREGIVVEDVPS